MVSSIHTHGVCLAIQRYFSGKISIHSLGGVTKVGGIRCGDWWWHFFHLKKSWPILLIVLEKDKLMTFFSHRLTDYCHVTTPTLSLFSDDRLFSVLVNSAAKILRLSLGCHLLHGIPGALTPPRTSDAIVIHISYIHAPFHFWRDGRQHHNSDENNDTILATSSSFSVEDSQLPEIGVLGHAARLLFLELLDPSLA